MRTKLLLILTVLCLVLIPFVSYGCAPKPTSTEPKMLKRWTGTGAFNTEPFTVQFSPFAISWASTPTQGAGSFFQANLFDSTAAPILAITNTTVREASSTYVYRSGTFYIAVNAANTQWALEIWGYT